MPVCRVTCHFSSLLSLVRRQRWKTTRKTQLPHIFSPLDTIFARKQMEKSCVGNMKISSKRYGKILKFFSWLTFKSRRLWKSEIYQGSGLRSLKNPELKLSSVCTMQSEWKTIGLWAKFLLLYNTSKKAKLKPHISHHHYTRPGHAYRIHTKHTRSSFKHTT